MRALRRLLTRRPDRAEPEAQTLVLLRSTEATKADEEAAGATSLEAQCAAFAASLGERTGRDLPGWLSLIAKAQFTDKNHVLDFLIERGFTFTQASWLEQWHRRGLNPFSTTDVTRTRQPNGRAVSQEERCQAGPLMTVRKAAQMAQVHAHAVLLELQASRAGDEVLARECEAIYLDLCEQQGWEPIRWSHKNGVGHHLRQLTGGAKPYRDVIVGQGQRRRLCVYAIPRPAPTPVRTERARRDRQVVDDVTRMEQPMSATAA